MTLNYVNDGETPLKQLKTKKNSSNSVYDSKRGTLESQEEAKLRI